jgi:S1-C subfamily serine protease
MRTSCCAIFIGVLVALWSGAPACGQSPSDEVRKELEKEFDAARKALAEKVSAIISKQEERIAALERQVKDKDREIAELKKKVEELAAGKPKTPDVAPAKPKGNAILGVEAVAVGDEDRSKLNLKEDQGSKVISVVAGSPAEKAGIKAGDIILSLAGKDVSGIKIREVVLASAPGDKVEVVYLRGAEKFTKTAELVDREKLLAGGAKPVQPETPKPPETPKEPPKGPVVLGLLVEETDAGLVVQNVESGKTGAVAQIKEGDVITSVNGKKVKNLDEISDLISKAKIGEEMTIEYKRKAGEIRAKVIAAGEQGEPKLVNVEGPKGGKVEEQKPAQKPPVSLGLQVIEEDGVRVVGVTDGGIGAVSGLRDGDVIAEVGGKAVRTVDDLKAALKDRAGDTVTIAVIRNGERKVLENVKLGAKETAEKPPEQKPPEKKPEPAKKKGVMGITANETESMQGIAVTGVTAGGPAEKAGIRTGDVIRKVNGVEIKGFDDLARTLKDVYSGDKVKLEVKRGGETKEIEVVLGPAEGALQGRAPADYSPVHVCLRALGARALVLEDAPIVP